MPSGTFYRADVVRADVSENIAHACRIQLNIPNFIYLQDLASWVRVHRLQTEERYGIERFQHILLGLYMLRKAGTFKRPAHRDKPLIFNTENVFSEV
jgi:hypothetical protein